MQAAKGKNLAGCQLIGVNLATVQNKGRAFEAIAELREVVEQQNRAIAYDPSQGWSSGSLVL
ncbi:hypothetical protein NW863_11800 [Synechococcus sp. B60.1]|uniref:hypothetical protein n=1 Tax=Synechococcus sp. B60.1 TaxID=2964522 RepID=UPI0039C12B97